MTSLVKIAVCAALALGVAAATNARADERDFSRFCADWMRKLEQREAYNQRHMKLRNNDGRMVGEYTGYGRDPLSCRTRERVEPGKRTVGMLVYREILYRKQALDLAALRFSEPRAIATFEVMEIFPFDGQSWKY